MIHAYVFARLKPGTSESTMKRIPTLAHVQSVSIVSGAYDMVVRVSVSHLEQLHDVTNTIHIIPGILKTSTQIIEKEFSTAS
jgi:DNA-binding Lrp family transcriptional regulator